jgi:hypothetical protein
MIFIKLNKSLGFDETDKEIIETKTYIALERSKCCIIIGLESYC